MSEVPGEVPAVQPRKRRSVPPKILVTGASSGVGLEVVRRLVDEGHPVRAGVRQVERARRLVRSGVDWVPFDFREPSTWGAAFEGIQRLLLVRPVGVRWLWPVLRHMERAGGQHVVFLSPAQPVPHPLDPSLWAEWQVRLLRMKLTSLRVGLLMQNLEVLHRALLRKRAELWLPGGAGRASFVDARDVAQVALRVLVDGGLENTRHLLTGSQALRAEEVAEHLSWALGRSVRSNPTLWMLLQRRKELSPALLWRTWRAYRLMRLGLAARVSPDLEKLLGRPPTTFRKYLLDNAMRFLETE